ncbi:hypothetical protein WDW89_14300 [Deltaproteobacteria bacterium TL4]
MNQSLKETEHGLTPNEFMDSLPSFMMTHHARSGVMFLHSLLDGHAEILGLPGYFEFTSLLETPNLKDPDQALEIFLASNEFFFDTAKGTSASTPANELYCLGENRNEGIYTSKKVFLDYYYQFLKPVALNPGNVIKAIYYSYAKAHKMDLSHKKIMLHHPHNHISAIKYHKYFKDAKAIATVRHPINGYISTLKQIKEKSRIRNQLFYHFDVLPEQCNHFYPLLENKIEIIVFKIDSFSQKQMKQLCELIGISYARSLEDSTFMGKKFWGNSLKGKSHGFSKAFHQEQLLGEISTIEQVILTTLTKELNTLLNYEIPELSLIQKYLFPFFFLIPTPLEIKMMKENYPKLKVLKWFLKTRAKLLLYLIKNTLALRPPIVLSLCDAGEGEDTHSK